MERVRQVRELCPQGVDVVVEMTGAKHVVPEGVQLLRNGGHYAFAGMVHPDSQLSSLTVREAMTILEEAMMSVLAEACCGTPLVMGTQVEASSSSRARDLSLGPSCFRDLVERPNLGPTQLDDPYAIQGHMS